MEKDAATEQGEVTRMRFEDKIRCLALLFDFSVTSWIRSRKSYAAVGACSDSSHVIGLAVDVVLDDVTETRQFTRRAVKLGLHTLIQDEFIHVQEPRS